MQGDTIDDIAWRHYGATLGAVEAILSDVRNYRLSNQPVVMPIGTRIVLPDLTITRLSASITLWNPPK
jgi:phage tail protein X